MESNLHWLLLLLSAGTVLQCTWYAKCHFIEDNFLSLLLQLSIKNMSLARVEISCSLPVLHNGVFPVPKTGQVFCGLSQVPWIHSCLGLFGNLCFLQVIPTSVPRIFLPPRLQKTLNFEWEGCSKFSISLNIVQYWVCVLVAICYKRKPICTITVAMSIFACRIYCRQ